MHDDVAVVDEHPLLLVHPSTRRGERPVAAAHAASISSTSVRTSRRLGASSTTKARRCRGCRRRRARRCCALASRRPLWRRPSASTASRAASRPSVSSAIGRSPDYVEEAGAEADRRRRCRRSVPRRRLTSIGAEQRRSSPGPLRRAGVSSLTSTCVTAGTGRRPCSPTARCRRTNSTWAMAS